MTTPDKSTEERRLRLVIERDRTRAADALSAIRRAVNARTWLREGRGPYEWDDAQYQAEFGAALDEIETALIPLARLAADWSDCFPDWPNTDALSAIRRAVNRRVAMSDDQSKSTERQLRATAEGLLAAHIGPKELFRPRMWESCVDAVLFAICGERERCRGIVEPYCNSSELARRISDRIMELAE